MSDVAYAPRFRLMPFLIRTAIGFVLVFAVIALAVGGRFGGFLAYLSRANYAPHAPNLALAAEAPVAVKIHLAAVLVALGLGFVQLFGPKGTTVHRVLGWSWVLLMLAAAASSLFIRELNNGAFSLIHILALATLISAPLGVYYARKGRILQHSGVMTGLFTGGLILAGVLAFMPGRLMWRMFFG